MFFRKKQRDIESQLQATQFQLRITQNRLDDFHRVLKELERFDYFTYRNRSITGYTNGEEPFCTGIRTPHPDYYCEIVSG